MDAVCGVEGYRDAKPLCAGTHGLIFIANDILTGQRLVLKRVVKSMDQRRRIQNEVGAGLKLRGVPQVPRFHQYVETTEHGWLIFDYAKGVDLLTWMEQYDFTPVPEITVQEIALQLVTTMQLVHSRGVAHKDIKLENIILDPDTGLVSVLDFGLCFNFRNGRDMCRDFAGSREYSPPELLLSYGPFSSTKTDVWSLGVTLYALLFGCFPFGFDAKAVDAMIASEKHPSVTFPRDSQVSDDAKSLLLRMMDVDASKRISMCDISSHPWLTTF